MAVCRDQGSAATTSEPIQRQCLRHHSRHPDHHPQALTRQNIASSVWSISEQHSRRTSSPIGRSARFASPHTGPSLTATLVHASPLASIVASMSSATASACLRVLPCLRVRPAGQQRALPGVRHVHCLHQDLGHNRPCDKKGSAVRIAVRCTSPETSVFTPSFPPPKRPAEFCALTPYNPHLPPSAPPKPPL